jgi:hypothetical protein
MSTVSNSETKKLLLCSFCGKNQHEVRKLIAGDQPPLSGLGGMLV